MLGAVKVKQNLILINSAKKIKQIKRKKWNREKMKTLNNYWISVYFD